MSTLRFDTRFVMGFLINSFILLRRESDMIEHTRKHSFLACFLTSLFI